MSDDRVMRLVLDALYCRRLSAGTTSFVVSEAGMELIGSDATVLPAIEEVLREVGSPDKRTEGS